MTWLFIHFSDSPFLFTPALSGSSSISDYNTEHQTTKIPSEDESVPCVSAMFNNRQFNRRANQHALLFPFALNLSPNL